MILLKKSYLDNSQIYNIGTADCPSAGSNTDLFTNIVEMANVLDPFEIVYDRATKKLENFNLVIDKDTATTVLKPFYQIIRHGLAFDWTMNHVMNEILSVLPKGSRYPYFKGTAPFIDSHLQDPIFAGEINKIEESLQQVFKWVFEDHYFDYLLTLNMNNLSEKDQELVNRSYYLVFLTEMIFDSIGQVVLNHWTEQFTKMSKGHPFVEDDVIIVGGHFRAFAYGNLDGSGIKWHLLDKGITMSGSYRTQRKEYIRVFPDEMTFVRIEDGAMIIDETFFPTISIGAGAFINAVDFQNYKISCALDTPIKLTISYKFKQDINTPKQIKLRAGENCIIKDQIVTLDANGKAETQIIFRGNSVTFKISDPDKKYPFGLFTTKQIIGDSSSFAWQ